MKKLCLMRHAKSSWKHAELSDAERPLNKRGLHDAPAMGRHLAALGLAPQRILSSSATRALVTARTVAEQLGYPTDRIIVLDDIYLAEAHELLDIVRATDESITDLMLFGHNPGFTELANALSGAAIGNMPTAGAVHLSFDITSWQEVAPSGGQLLFFEYPKKLPHL